MRQLNGVYTQKYNRRNNKVGHVFQGRFKGVLVDGDTYLMELARYIVLNPVRAQMVRSAKEWKWSSYRATVGAVACPEWLDREWLLRSFAKRQSTAIESFKRFVAGGKNQPSPGSVRSSVSILYHIQNRIDSCQRNSTLKKR